MANESKTLILVVNTESPVGLASETFTKSLYRELISNHDKAKPNISVSIHPDKPDKNQVTPWSIIVNNEGSIKHCLIKEINFSTANLRTLDLLKWLFRSPKRNAAYFSNQLQQIERESKDSRKKLPNLIGKITKLSFFQFYCMTFYTFFQLLSLMIIEPIRKVGTALAVIYMSGILCLFILATWKDSLLPILKWTSNLTQQLITLTKDSNLTYDILFPIIAGVFFSIALSVIVFIVRFVKSHMFSNPDKYGHMESDFAYLFDPLYAASIYDYFENEITELDNVFNAQKLVIIGDNRGALLSYEVMSKLCDTIISKPVFILTKQFTVGGLKAGPVRFIWLLLDRENWFRLSKTTPNNLSWHFFSYQPTEEITLKLTSLSDSTIPKVELQSERHAFFKKPNAILLSRVIKILESN